MDIPTAIAKSWPYVMVAAPGVYAVVKDLLGRRAIARKAEADLMQMAQDAASGVIHTLREEADRLAHRLEQVEAELGDLRREHSRMPGMPMKPSEVVPTMADEGIVTLAGEPFTRRNHSSLTRPLERSL